MFGQTCIGERSVMSENMDAQTVYDVKNREVVMLIKLSITNEMIPEVQDGNETFIMWGNL
jgi:hypothetical protein